MAQAFSPGRSRGAARERTPHLSGRLSTRSWLARISFRTNHALCSAGRKTETAAANASTFEIMFRAMGRGAAGYAKPNTAHTAKIKNRLARRNRLALDSFTKGENVSIAKLRISTRKERDKEEQGKRDGRSGRIRSPHHDEIEGSSRSSGGIVPTMALPTATRNPLCLVRYAITKKATTAAVNVTAVMGSAVTVKCPPSCRYNAST